MHGYENIITDWELNASSVQKLPNILVKEASIMEIIEGLFFACQ